MATTFRDRFLRERTRMGAVRYTLPGLQLGPPEPVWGEPADGLRWEGRVRFLTSPLTFSASEDAMLGLQGLDHVQLVGQPTGGGSGRLRRLPLLPGWRLTITGALCYDREGRCIEGVGLPVDVPVRLDRAPETGTDLGLLAAESAPWRP
jgi:carboxyl-terminal processing protease